jgi:membrane-associated PAP2 superfamily phosphatase
MNRTRRLYSPDGFWISHGLLPALGFTFALAVFTALDLDRRLAHAWFFDARAGGWVGMGPGDWWAHRMLHDGGRWVVRGIAAVALACWLLSFTGGLFRPWRRAAAYVFVAMAVAVLLVGLLKAVSNVDCPWDLAGFGGERPYLPLLADRPDYLPRGRCFPGAHAASGFALLSLYFVARDFAPLAARWMLAAAVAVGATFSIGQQARGAHFLTHDLTSAAIVWFVQLALYRWMLDPRAERLNRSARDQGSGGGTLRLPGLAPEEEQCEADHDQRDADAHANVGAPITNPVGHRTGLLQVLQDERGSAVEEQDSTDDLHEFSPRRMVIVIADEPAHYAQPPAAASGFLEQQSCQRVRGHSCCETPDYVA